MHDPAVNLAEPHHDAEELIPWYATGQLDGEDLSLVEQHLSNCAHCRRQLAFERGMVDEFARLSPEIDSGWTRLRQRVEAPHRRETPWARLGNQAIELWHSLNRPAIATLAFAQLAFVVVVGALFLSLGKPDYRALGSAPAPQSANAIVMFRADASEAHLRELLQSNGASMVGGPTTAGAYLLKVPSASRASTLERLRADRNVTMAQPIDGPAS